MKEHELKPITPIHKCCGNCKHLEHIIEASRELNNGGIASEEEIFRCEIKYKYTNVDIEEELSMAFYSHGDYDEDDNLTDRWLYVCDLWKQT